MTDVLSVTKFNCIGDYLYFFTEEESIFGKIEIASGNVEYFENTPANILGCPAHNLWMMEMNSNVYGIVNASDGLDIIAFETKTSEFTEGITSQASGLAIHGGWAGIIQYRNKIYAFPREDGVIIIYDVIKRTVSQQNTNIEDKIVWACGYEESVYMLSWDCKVLYSYNLSSRDIEAYNVNISELSEMKSKTIFPVHNMVCDNGFVYIYDAHNIFRFDVKDKKISLFYIASGDDNGSRIIVTEKNIIIPPFDKDTFYILDKEMGTLDDIRFFSDKITYANLWRGNKTGIPCENEKKYFLPVINSNVVLCIDKVSMDFTWLSLEISKDNINDIVKTIIEHKNVITESPTISIERFLESLLNGI